MDRQTLYACGEHGYACYRIPSLITLPDNRVLAFAEGRVESAADHGTIHIVLRISLDGGHTFGARRVIATNGNDTVGNPTPVFDRVTGRLFLFLNGNRRDGPESEIMKNRAPRTTLVTCSDDGGDSWATLADLTPRLKQPGWTWYAFGPCHAIQMRSGRLMIPANHGVFNQAIGNSDKYVSHVVFSDDHGRTWMLGGDVGDHTNECALAELSDGRLYMNMRSYHGKSCRAVSESADGGLHWSPVRLDSSLPEPVCQGSTLTYPFTALGANHPLLFVNPAHPEKRVNLTVRMSADGGGSWRHSRVLHAGPASYSDLTVLPNRYVGCLFECGEHNCTERIDYAAFPIQWVADEGEA